MSAQEGTRRRVAAFDFDGTVSRRDTLVPFVARVAGMPASAVAAGAAAWSGARGHIDWRSRDDVKSHLIERLLAGRSEDELRAQGRAYADKVLAGGLRPAVVERLRAHVAADHDTLFVSASLVYYLEPLAEHFGLDGVIAVDPEVDSTGRLTGRMRHPNVRAEQKAVRLPDWLGCEPVGDPAGRAGLEDVELWAYGNSSGDHELLEIADHRFWLGRPAKCPAGAQQFPVDGPSPAL